jgi:hypothetical protein
VRLVVQAELVVPGLSGGLEHFTSGLLRGLDRQVTPGDEVVAVVARGTKREWRDAVGHTRELRFVEVASTASLARFRQRSSRFGPFRRTLDWLAHSPATRPWVARIRGGVERRSLAQLDPDVVYYPHRPVNGCASSSVLTVHHLPQGQGGPWAGTESQVLANDIGAAGAVVTSWPHPDRDIRRTFPEVVVRLSMPRRVVYRNNIPSPCAVACLNAVAVRRDLAVKVWFCSRTEPDRSWAEPPWVSWRPGAVQRGGHQPRARGPAGLLGHPCAGSARRSEIEDPR